MQAGSTRSHERAYALVGAAIPAPRARPGAGRTARANEDAAAAPLRALPARSAAARALRAAGPAGGRRRRARRTARGSVSGAAVASRPRPRGPLAWLHGASVGETLSLLPLVERLTQRGLAVLVTSGTVTSAQPARRAGCRPARSTSSCRSTCRATSRRFLDHWRPDLALFAESELWPNT